MLIKINSALNEQKNELPTNIVSEALNQKLELMDIQDNLKLILLGDLNVGKTSFFKRYFNNQFINNDLLQIDTDREIRHVKVANYTYSITTWDTCGCEKFKCLPKNIIIKLMVFFFYLMLQINYHLMIYLIG